MSLGSVHSAEPNKSITAQIWLFLRLRAGEAPCALDSINRFQRPPLGEGSTAWEGSISVCSLTKTCLNPPCPSSVHLISQASECASKTRANTWRHAGTYTQYTCIHAFHSSTRTASKHQFVFFKQSLSRLVQKTSLFVLYTPLTHQLSHVVSSGLL